MTQKKRCSYSYETLRKIAIAYSVIYENEIGLKFFDDVLNICSDGPETVKILLDAYEEYQNKKADRWLAELTEELADAPT